jgi:S-adenosylmethionine:tRNA ribosyltransferase-isomerase
VVERKQKFYRLQLEDTSQTILDIIERLGEIPLPPYIKRAAEASDKERYQTVYARYKGSVAAPTAGLHFDENLLQRLSEKNVNLGYLTLHIGAGTFTPVHASDIQAHQMHAETISVSEGLCQQIQQTKANGKRVIAVGTTTLRALETVASRGSLQAYTGDTSIFITPGHRFNSADVLITNLHLPKSTLLMLVCAFGGYRSVMRAYHHAVDAQYRFYSYGDAMWIPLAAADGIATDSTT